ncbi:hypothetical protein [Microbacterium sp. A1-JK]|uniref:hypothetical protein n=1 Tax=Microbacterium sp. A1-JK TaxID=3177516 RepID=UPI003886F4EE
MPSPFVYLPGVRLTEAELSAACLDGHLVALGDGYIPADVVETVVLRAASVGHLLGAALAATHESAAWILGRLDEPPARHSVQRAVDRRLHHVVSRRLLYRDPLIEGADLLSIADIRVSTPARTLADLARSPEASSREFARRWAKDRPDDADEAVAWLDRHRSIPHKRGARILLASVRTS